MDQDKTKTTESQINLQTSLFSLSDCGSKKVEVAFTTEQISVDGGLLLLKEVDKTLD